MSRLGRHLLLTPCLVLALTMAGCGGNDDSGSSSGGGDGSTLEQAKEQGSISLAIANEPPLTEVKPDGTLAGMVPDVARAVVAELGIPEVTGVVSTYDAMIPGLQAKRWDMIGAGLYMNKERCEQVLFAAPDTVSEAGLVVPKGNPKNISSYQDFADNPDLKLVVASGSFEETHARNMGVKDSQFVQLPDVPSGVNAVLAGRGDAFASNVPAAEAVDKEGFEVVVADDAPPLASGVAFRKEDRELRDQYNAAYNEIKQNGEFAKIAKKYGFDPQLIIDTTVEDVEPACAD